MRPVSVTVIGAAGAVNSSPIVVDQYIGPAEFGLMFDYVSGATTTFVVQYSLDDPFAVYATDYNTDANWVDVTGFTALAADKGGVLAQPVRALRLRSNAGAGGTGKLTVVQSGIR